MKRTSILIKVILSVFAVFISAGAHAQYDWTGRIENAGFESGTSGWTVQKTVSGWEDIGIKTSDNAEGSSHYNLWAGNVTTVGLYQSFTLPAGKYSLSAQIRTNATGLSDQHVYVTTSAGTLTSSNISVANAWEKLSIDFTLDKEEEIVIGAIGNGTGSGEKGWLAIDDFQLSGDQVMPNDGKTTGEQVTDAISLTGYAEYHITSSEPFATTGHIDFAETDHAVLFLDSLRPSEAAKYLDHISIKGEDAVAEKNCQLRLYDHGTLVFPYGKESKKADGFHPLTVYTEQNCGGESCDLFGTENTGGFMNTLTDATLNNRIRSFRLKRGYMVTFSIGAEGYGYQRCFIADKEDLVLNSLPTMLDQKISSYRIFRFNNIGKNGVANILNTDNLKKLNCTWTYAWGVGNSLGTDYECVPHMNNLWSATTYSLGVNDQSPYMKTDNEPANSNDNHPATVAQELERWPELMRTGRRLLTPSSFDSGEWWHKQFLDSIDARGWRCDVIDIHSYWNESSFNNIKSSWADKYGRPVWITEFIWGASWSGGFGIFGVATTSEERGNPSDATLQKNAEVLTRIWANLNSMDYVERYAYWNDEWACSKILWNGNLTPAGEVYSKMKTGTSYKGTYEKVPTNWRLSPVNDLAATFVQRTGIATVTWKTNNFDLAAMTLQRSTNGTTWEDVYTKAQPDSVSYTFSETLTDEGIYMYRVKEKTYKNTTLYSNVASVSLSAAHGNTELQYGSVSTANAESVTVPLISQDERAIVFTGLMSSNNSSVGVIPHITSFTKAKFNVNIEPWTLPETGSIENKEDFDFLAIKPGNYIWGNMTAEVDTCRYLNASGTVATTSRGDTIQVNFNKPFADGVTPIVIVQPISSFSGIVPTAKVFDVTNTGFKMKLMKQSGDSRNIPAYFSYYFAITPGAANLNDVDSTGSPTMSIYAGTFDNAIGGLTFNTSYFKNEDGDTLRFYSPYIFAGTQTHNLDYLSILRQKSAYTETVTEEDGTKSTATIGLRIKRQMDTSITSSEIGANTASKNGDKVGWIVINSRPIPADPTAIRNVPAISAGNDIYYDLSGRKVKNPSRVGIYIHNGKKIIIK